MISAGNPATGTARVKRGMAEHQGRRHHGRCHLGSSPHRRGRRCGCGNGVGKGARRYPRLGRCRDE